MTTPETKPEGEFSDIGLHLEVTRLRAENRRLEAENEKLRQTNSEALLAKLARFTTLALNQQIELTKSNRALNKKNRLIKRLREQLNQYRAWAIRTPLDGDRSLMAATEKRINFLRDADSRSRIERHADQD